MRITGKRGGVGSNENSLRARIRRWLQENPGEALSEHDVGVKFDVTPRQARYALHDLTAHGVTKSARVYFLNT